MHCHWLHQLDATMTEQRLKHADAILGVSGFIVPKGELSALINAATYNGADLGAVAPATDERVRWRKTYSVRGSSVSGKGVHVLLMRSRSSEQTS
jgi:hypothetical protein